MAHQTRPPPWKTAGFHQHRTERFTAGTRLNLATGKATTTRASHEVQLQLSFQGVELTTAVDRGHLVSGFKALMRTNTCRSRMLLPS